ncbi:MAG: HAD family phosphatase [Candidatus Liptonbacteria bacterium]|nr:HAD family phosphatase [Candidatus Liptonbacteria bacterium]
MKKNIKKRKVAVFDIDGTVFRSSLLIELVETLIQNGIFSLNARKEYAKEYEQWLDRKDSYEKYINAVIGVFDKNIKGLREKDLESAVKKIISSRRNRLYRYTRNLIADLKKKDYYLLAISHSPMYVVGRFARKLGFDKVYGLLLETDVKKHLTGKHIYKDLILDKAKILERAVEKENLTLKGSVGVGDTESDISFLKMVDNPICFNPNSALYRVAKKNGWHIVAERKDVIYKIK